MAKAKVSQPQQTGQTPKSDQPLHQLLEEAEKLPIKERVPFLEQRLESGTIDEAAFVYLGEAAIRHATDDAREKDLSNIHRQFGGERHYKLYQRRKMYWKLWEEARQRWLAEIELFQSQATVLDDEPRLRLTMDQYRRLEAVWYAIDELSSMIDPPDSEGGGLKSLSIVNESLGAVIHELERQLEKGGQS